MRPPYSNELQMGGGSYETYGQETQSDSCAEFNWCLMCGWMLHRIESGLVLGAVR